MKDFNSFVSVIFIRICKKNFWHFDEETHDDFFVTASRGVIEKYKRRISGHVTQFILNSLAVESRFVTFTHFLGKPRRKVSTVFSSGLEAVVVAFTRSRCCRVSHLHNAQIRACKYVIQTKQVSPRAVLLLILLCWRQRSVKKLKAMLSCILKAESIVM